MDKYEQWKRIRAKYPTLPAWDVYCILFHSKTCYLCKAGR